MTKPDVKLWLASNRGVYIPQHFAQSFIDRDAHVSGVSAETWATLEAGPDYEWYWEAWEDALNNAIVTDEHGVKHYVWQDGDCWLIPCGMIQEDGDGEWIWPEDGETSDSPYHD